VAHGKEFESAIIFHGMELLEDVVKATIEKVLVLFALFLLPTNEVYTMAHAFQCFLA